MSVAHIDRPDWQKEAIAIAVDAYHASIDAIVNYGDAGQEALEGALEALESQLLTVCGLDADAVNALLDRLFETA